MSSEIKILVLDLDGTLARTEHLHTGRRVPFDILKNSPPSFNSSPFLYRQEFKYEFGLLIEQGIPVIVITRSPQSYASTLLYLLVVDFTECYPNSEMLPNVCSKIDFIANAYEVLPEHILYIGDRVEDRELAHSSGCQFEYPYWVSESTVQVGIAEDNSLYTELIDFHNQNIGLLETCNKTEELESLCMKAEKGELLLNRENLQLVSHNSSYSGLQLFIQPLISEISFSPAINPKLISRWDYENRFDLIDLLYELIRHLFKPMKLIPGPNNPRKEHLGGIEIRAFSTYAGTFLGEKLWAQCKDWKGKSGQEVRLHLLEIVALVMSAFLTPEAILIPAPASVLSPTQPGEVSRRLAARISQLRRTNLLDILHKTDSFEISIEPTEFISSGKLYCLLDDQLTNGRTIELCLEKFPLEVQKNLSLIVWSYSATGGRWVEAPILEF